MLFSFIAGLVSVNFCETILNNEKVIKKIKPFTIKKNEPNYFMRTWVGS